ncbi:hypothetical protein LTR24_007520 [Lithohypha guttulata]|uniref:RING-type domain-containing protein n=1 Tax=Lithohypha guttulata TaxID=1690604 RepID=A0ABR0K491_9EURO|nr:hypothetical protein LTR24_007520 [Lithohypha guttulata]
MSIGTRQSSRERSSAAIEIERLAQEKQRHADSLQEQITALLAQRQAAEESSKKYHEEAEARQQDAREQSFFEVQSAKQADFRHVISDEVFIRVARELKRNDDWEYVKALAERRPGFEDPVLFKCLLWDALAGNESDFLTTAAHKVLDRLDKKIGDADVAAIKSSVVCLASNVIALEDDHMKTPGSHKAASRPNSAYHARDATPTPKQVEKAPNLAVGVVDENQMHIPTDNRIEEEPVRSQEIQAVRSFSCEASQEEHNGRHNESLLKQESVIPEPASGGRRSMDDIDNEDLNGSGQPLNAMSADTLNSFLQDEDADMLSIRGRSTTPATPSKRPRDDASVTSKRISQAKTPKRPRTAKDPNPTSPRIKLFVKHIEDMAENDTLQVRDFSCASCGACTPKMKDPRIAQCLHLYENKCLMKIRKGHKKGGKVPCVYSGCGKEIGTTANKIAVEDLRGLKKKHLDQLAEDEGAGVDIKDVDGDEIENETDDE